MLKKIKFKDKFLQHFVVFFRKKSTAKLHLLTTIFFRANNTKLC